MKTSINMVFLICAVFACAGIAQANEDEDVREAALNQLSSQTRTAKIAIEDEEGSVQVQDGQHLLSVNAGLSFPITKIDLTDVGGKNETAVKNGFTFGGQYIYQFTPAWGLGVELGYYSYGEKDRIIPLYAKIRSKALATTAQAVVRYVFLPEKKLHYYLIGGLGYGNMKIAAKTKPIDGAYWIGTNPHSDEWRDNFSTSISGIVFSLGAGVEQNISNSIVAVLDFRWFNIGTKKTVDDKAFDTPYKIPNQRNIAITYGIGWKFGG